MPNEDKKTFSNFTLKYPDFCIVYNGIEYTEEELYKIELESKLFLENVKEQAENTKEAGEVIRKYMSGQDLSKEDEEILKTQLVDWLKIVGVVVPFVLIPGASILMPFLIKIAEKHKIEIMPTAFQNKKKLKIKNKK